VHRYHSEMQWWKKYLGPTATSNER
jgi:hypothetical protein